MRKFIRWPDGHSMELSPITFDEFEAIGHWQGSNDTAFDRFLIFNRFTELDRLKEEARATGEVYFQPGEPAINWNYDEHLAPVFSGVMPIRKRSLPKRAPEVFYLEPAGPRTHRIVGVGPLPEEDPS
jgi:hypothetical protein